MRLTLFLTLLPTLAFAVEPVRRFAAPIPQADILRRSDCYPVQTSRHGEVLYLHDRAVNQLIVLTCATGQSKPCVRFSADAPPDFVVMTQDDRFALAVHANSVEIWSLADGRRLHHLRALQIIERKAGLTVRGGEAIVVTYRKTGDQQFLGAIRLTDGVLFPFESQGDLLGLADQGSAVVVQNQQRLSIVDATTGKERRGIAPEKPVNCYVASPGQDYALAIERDAISHIDLQTLRQRPLLPFAPQSWTLSDDGRQLALVTAKRLEQTLTIHTFNGDPPRQVTIPEPLLEGLVLHLWRFTPDGRSLISRRYGQRFRVDGPPHQQPLLEMRVPIRLQNTLLQPFLEFRSDEELLSIDDQRLLQARSIRTGQTLWSLRLPRDRMLWKAYFSPTRDRIALLSYASNGKDDQLDFIDLTATGATLRPSRTDGVHDGGLEGFFTADGSRFLRKLSIDDRAGVGIWDVKTGKRTHVVDVVPPFEATFDVYGRIIRETAKGLRLRETDGEWGDEILPAGRSRWKLPTIGASKLCTDHQHFLPDRLTDRPGPIGCFLSLGGISGGPPIVKETRWYLGHGETALLGVREHQTCELYDLRDPEPFARLPETAVNLTLSPDGQRLAIASEDGATTIWDVGALRAQRPIVRQPLSAKSWADAWRTTRSEHSSIAMYSLRQLELDPEQTLRELPRRMPIAVQLNPQDVRALFTKLSDATTRESAAEELFALDVRIQPFAAAHLRTLTPTDSEAWRLTEYLATKSNTPYHPANRQAFRTIELLDRLRADDLLRQYAAGDPEAILTMEAKYALEQRR